MNLSHILAETLTIVLINSDFWQKSHGFAYLNVKVFCLLFLFTSCFEGLDRGCQTIFTFQGCCLSHSQYPSVVFPKFINPLMLSLCLILPTRLFSLPAFWVVTTKGWIHDEFSLKACHYKSCARAPGLWLTSMLHSASHSLHMSSTAPSSIHANVRGGWQHSHMPCRVWPVG